MIYLVYPKAYVIQNSTLDSVTRETYLLESKFSSREGEGNFARHHPLSRLHGVLKRMREMVDGGEWEKRRGKGRFRLFARLFGT